MAFGKGFRPVLAPGAELGSDGAGARSGPMTELSEVTRSNRRRAVQEIDLEVSRGECDTQSARAPVYSIASCEVHRVTGIRGATRSARRRRSGV